jgi:hypothetical protein
MNKRWGKMQDHDETEDMELSFFDKLNTIDGDNAFFANSLLLKKLKEMHQEERYCADLTKEEILVFGTILFLSKEEMEKLIKNTTEFLICIKENENREDIYKKCDYLDKVRFEKEHCTGDVC